MNKMKFKVGDKVKVRNLPVERTSTHEYMEEYFAKQEGHRLGMDGTISEIMVEPHLNYNYWARLKEASFCYFFDDLELVKRKHKLQVGDTVKNICPAGIHYLKTGKVVELYNHNVYVRYFNDSHISWLNDNEYELIEEAVEAPLQKQTEKKKRSNLAEIDYVEYLDKGTVEILGFRNILSRDELYEKYGRVITDAYLSEKYCFYTLKLGELLHLNFETILSNKLKVLPVSVTKQEFSFMKVFMKHAGEKLCSIVKTEKERKEKEKIEKLAKSYESQVKTFIV